jgi:hypothetical protein
MSEPPASPARWLDRLVRWAFVAAPLAWGVWETIRSSLALFR